MAKGIEAEYYFKESRHNCNKRYYGSEIIFPNDNYQLNYFKPGMAEVICSDEGYANFFVDTSSHPRLKAGFVTEQGKFERVSTRLPIVLQEGQTFKLEDKFRAVEFRMVSINAESFLGENK